MYYIRSVEESISLAMNIPKNLLQMVSSPKLTLITVASVTSYLSSRSKMFSRMGIFEIRNLYFVFRAIFEALYLEMSISIVA